MATKTTKINRKTDVLENQIQLDGDLDALITSAVHRQCIRAQQMHPVHCSQTHLAPAAVMERPAGKHQKCPKESQSLESPKGEHWTRKVSRVHAKPCLGPPPQHCAGTSAPGR